MAHSKRTLIKLGAVGAVAAYIFYAASAEHGSLSSQSKTVAPPCPGGAGMAYVMSQNFVKRQLKSPSTAKFPSGPLSSNRTGDCSFAVTGYVDAQNSFGAALRSNYSVEMKYLPDEKKWQATNLQIDG